MLNVLELQPTTNYALDSPSEKSDQMEAFARVLMGLSHPLQLIGQTREIEVHPTWPRPPRLERKWFAVLDDDDGWRTGTLRTSLEGVGLYVRTESRPGDRTSDIYGDIRAGSASQEIAEIGPHSASRDGIPTASLVLRRWPREVAPGWLGNALSGDLPVDVAIHIMPQDSAWIARKLKMQHQRHSDSDDAGDMLTTRDARRVREDLIAHKDRPVKVAVVFTVRAASPEILASRVETVRHEIGLALGDARPVTWEHDLGLEATSATGICRLRGAWHTLDCNSVASTWIYQPATVNHENGAPLGTTHTGSMEVRLDPFDESLESFGGLIIGKTGVGKSYLLKLIIRRLQGVEIFIVDQRRPSEYAGVANVQLTSLAGLSKKDKVARLRKFITDLWELAKTDPQPRLLVLDELYGLLKDPELAELVEEIAREGRHFFLSLWIATQQVRELLASGEAVLDNATVKVYLKQHDNDLAKLCDAVGLSTDARRFLRSAARGQALLDVSGMIVEVDVQASAEEHEVITTDPRERRAPLVLDTERMGSPAVLVPNGSLS